MKIVFGTFKKISVQISGEDHALYAFDILLPLYKVCEGFAGKVISGDFSLPNTISYLFDRMIYIIYASSSHIYNLIE